MDKLDQKILETYKDAKRKEKILLHIGHINEKITSESEKLRDIGSQIANLGLDILRLQNSDGVHKIKQLLFENDPEKAKELKLDYYIQAMNYKTLQKEIDLYQFELSVLNSQLKILKDVEIELKKLLQKKEIDLIRNHKEVAQKILEAQNEILFQTILVEETEEAINFGEKAFKLLNVIINELTEVIENSNFEQPSQHNYTNQDIIDYIGIAKKDIDLVYHWLQKFNLELKDISVHLKVDYLEHIKKFENLIDDLQKIFIYSPAQETIFKSSLIRLKFIRVKIDRMLKTLKKDINKANGSVKRWEKRKELLIIQSIKKD